MKGIDLRLSNNGKPKLESNCPNCNAKIGEKHHKACRLKYPT